MATEISKATMTYSLPNYQDREVADAISRTMSGAERENDYGRLMLRNPPNQRERTRLGKRLGELATALAQRDNKRAAAALTEMIAMYDMAQNNRSTAAQTREVVSFYMKELVDLPIWAVEEACKRIRLGTAGGDISRQYKPTTAQVRALAESIKQPWKEEAAKIDGILSAEPYREKVSEDDRKLMGEKMQKLVADMKAGLHRKAGSLSDQIDEQNRQRKQALVRRAEELNRQRVQAEWEAAGEKPVMAGDMMISRSLVNAVREQNAQRAAIPERAND